MPPGAICRNVILSVGLMKKEDIRPLKSHIEFFFMGQDNPSELWIKPCDNILSKLIMRRTGRHSFTASLPLVFLLRI